MRIFVKVKPSAKEAKIEKIDENNFIIADIVEARKFGEAKSVAGLEVNYMDVSTTQIISVGTSLIPFLEHDDANHALMGSNMQRQAVPLLNPEPPLVCTGVEDKVAKNSGQVVVAEMDGVITEVDANHIKIKNKDNRHAKTYDLSRMQDCDNCCSSWPSRDGVVDFRGEKIYFIDFFAQNF